MDIRVGKIFHFAGQEAFLADPPAASLGLLTAGRRYSGRVTLDPGWLFLSLIVSGAGFVLFTYGRKQERVPHLVAGLTYFVYPFFTPNVWSMLVVGLLVGAALWLVVRQGW